MKLPIECIVVSKDNPRQSFDEEGLRRLGESIKSHGQLQPIIVRPKGSNYELVAGERRLRASVLVGLDSIEAEVKDMDDSTAMEMRLIENTQREDLTDAEKGDAVLALWALGKYTTLKEVAEAINVSYDIVTRYWVPKARKLSEKVKQLVNSPTNNGLPEDAARSLVKYSHSIQETLANAIIKYNIRGGKSGEHPYREFLKLYDQNPNADLEDLANKVKGIKKVTVPESMLSPALKKQIEESKEERRQLAKVQRIRKKPSKPITKEDVKRKLMTINGKTANREKRIQNSAYKFEKVKVSIGQKGKEPPLKATIKPTVVPNEDTPDYSLCQCATCPLFAKHCKGRCWT